MTQRLAAKAAQHPDIDIQEVGEDFQNYLKTNTRERISLLSPKSSRAISFTGIAFNYEESRTF